MESVRMLLAVGGGGCLGAIARWSLGRWIVTLQGPPSATYFPWPTLSVNLLGCLAAGVLFGFWRTHPPASIVSTVVLSGFLGSFTTFSMFSLDALALNAASPKSFLVTYLFASVAGCIALASLGIWIGHSMANR